MTAAPATLVAVRRLLLDHLDLHETTTSYPADLDPGEVGIVGDAAHRGGYHCGQDRTISGDYSVVESSRDRTGLSAYASALDVGLFQVTVGGTTHDLRSMSRWIVAQCAAGAEDTRDIREVIYSPDGRTVRRWDRLGKRSGGDSSHLTHTHISYHRDSTKALRDQTPLFRRYLTTIGLLEDDMLTPAEITAVAERVWSASWGSETAGDRLAAALAEAKAARQAAETALATVRALATRDLVDEQAIVAGVLAQLTPAAIAAAIPASIAQQVAAELSRRLES